MPQFFKRDWWVARLKEPSTYVGILALLGSIGLHIDPSYSPVIGQALTTLGGALITYKEKKPVVSPNAPSA